MVYETSISTWSENCLFYAKMLSFTERSALSLERIGKLQQITVCVLTGMMPLRIKLQKEVTAAPRVLRLNIPTVNYIPALWVSKHGNACIISYSNSFFVYIIVLICVNFENFDLRIFKDILKNNFVKFILDTSAGMHWKMKVEQFENAPFYIPLKNIQMICCRLGIGLSYSRLWFLVYTVV